MALIAGMLPISASAYVPHSLHDPERVWAEKNCYVDLWIELLHSMGLDPVAACGFTLGSDFEGDQWTFAKFPVEDLRLLYGIDVTELNVWRPVLDHVFDQLERGRLLTVEVDSYHLPDTEGVAYELAHTKTTIVPQLMDVVGRRMEYFHNAGYFALAGDDFDGIFHRGASTKVDAMVPYVELVKLDGLRRDPIQLLARKADGLLAHHLERRRPDRPVARWADRIAADTEQLAAAGADFFHAYAFPMCREFGASAELAAAFTNWLADQGRPEPTALRTAGAHLQSCAESAKSVQFALSRLARGRTVDISGLLAGVVENWETAMSALTARTGS